MSKIVTGGDVAGDSSGIAETALARPVPVPRQENGDRSLNSSNVNKEIKYI